MGNKIIVHSGQSLDHQTYDNGGLREETYIEVHNGGTAAHDWLVNDATIHVSAGGSARELRLGNAAGASAAAYVSAGGSATDVFVDGYSTLDVAGTVTGVVISGLGRETETVEAGGAQIGGSVIGGSILVYGTLSDVSFRQSTEIVFGGTSLDAQLGGQSRQQVMAATVTSTHVDHGAVQTIGSGSIAVSTVLGFDGVSEVASGGVARDVTIGTGGVQIISAGGALDMATVQSGGVLLVLDDGSVSGVTAQAGGRVITSGIATVDSAGRATTGHGGQPVLWGSTEYILQGGISHDQTVDPGGTELVDSGGVARGAIVDGAAVVQSGGILNGATLYGSVVYDAGAAGRAINVQRGGVVSVTSGAVVDHLTIGPGGIARIDGDVHDLQLGSQGFADVAGSGVVHGAVISAGGTLLVENRTYPNEGFLGDGKEVGVELLQGGTLEFVDLHYQPDATATLGPDDLLSITQTTPQGTERIFRVHLAGDSTGDVFTVTHGHGNLDAIGIMKQAPLMIPAAELARDVAGLTIPTRPAVGDATAAGHGDIGCGRAFAPDDLPLVLPHIG